MYKRYYKKEDYAMMCEWWDDWGWLHIPEVFLPPTGIIIGDEQGDICAVFLYRTDSAIMWAENYISNKHAKGMRRKEAMQMLIEEAKAEALSLGFKVVMSAVKHDGLAKRLTGNGFTATDAGLTNYVGAV